MDRQIKKFFSENCHLVSILSGQRARESITAMDTRNITFEDNYVIVKNRKSP